MHDGGRAILVGVCSKRDDPAARLTNCPHRWRGGVTPISNLLSMVKPKFFSGTKINSSIFVHIFGHISPIMWLCSP